MIRAAGYLLVHSLVGGFRKLFRTWLAVLLVIMIASALLGGLMGLILGVTDSGEDTPDAPDTEQTLPGESDPDAPVESEPDGEGEDMEDVEDGLADLSGLIAANPERAERITAGIALTLTLIAWGFSLFFADRGRAGLFTMPDVNFLFASPQKPQSILLSREIALLVQSLLIVLWFGLYGLMLGSLRLLIGIALCALLILLCGRLIRCIAYVYANSRPKRARYTRAAGLILLLGGMAPVLWAAIPALLDPQSPVDPIALTEQIGGLIPLRLIPVAGFIADFAGHLLSGQFLLCLPGLALTLISAALLGFLLTRLHCDYYEDAMAQAAKTQEMLDLQAQKKQSARRIKDRPDRVRRDVISHGRGATAFLFRPLETARRSALFGIIPPACLAWLALSLITVLLTRTFDSTSPLPLIALHAIAQFLFSLGNPLGQELGMNFFWLAPDPPGKKLLCALSGELAKQSLHILPGYLIAGLLLGGSPALLLVGALLILSLTAFFAAVGLLLDLAVPGSLPAAVKLSVQLYARFLLIFPILIPLLLAAHLSGPLPALLTSSLLTLALSAGAFALCVRQVRKGRK